VAVVVGVDETDELASSVNAVVGTATTSSKGNFLSVKLSVYADPEQPLFFMLIFMNADTDGDDDVGGDVG
jgi:hypothetical protein